MTELKTEHTIFSSKEYVQRVATFLAEASSWCKDRGLSVENGAVTLREEGMTEYETPSLYLSKGDVTIAKIVPVGSKIVGAHGRVDLIGRVTWHALLFYAGKAPAFSTQTIVGEKTTRPLSTPLLPGVDRDGWYWIEARIRRAKRVEESLFIDLLTDASDCEF